MWRQKRCRIERCSRCYCVRGGVGSAAVRAGVGAGVGAGVLAFFGAFLAPLGGAGVGAAAGGVGIGEAAGPVGANALGSAAFGVWRSCCSNWRSFATLRWCWSSVSA